jgi:hypothetical protein
MNGLRLGNAIYFWDTLVKYGASPLYLSISGGFWLILGFFLIWGLWQGITWGRITIICGTLGYSSWYWFDRWNLQAPQANWPFALTMNTVLLLIIFIILFSQKTKRYFKRDVHERQPEPPTTT